MKKHKKNKHIIRIILLALVIVVGLFVTFTTPGKEVRARVTNTPLETYVACGCGGCKGDPVGQEDNIYDKKSFEDIKAFDQGVKGSSVCNIECNICVKYSLRP